MAAGGGLRVTHAGPHAWVPDEAPTYRCTLEGADGESCPAIGYRRLRSIRDAAIVEADSADVALWEARRDGYAEEALARSEGREWTGREGDCTPAVDEYLAGAREEDPRMPTTRHTWTEDDEVALRAAVEVVTAEPDDGEQSGGRHPRVLLWHAVAGILLRDGLRVSADACRTRWAVVEERERRTHLAAEAVQREAEARAEELRAERQAEAETPQGVGAVETRAVVEPDAWEALSRHIAAWEAESADELTAALCGLRSGVGELDLRVRAWEGRLERIEAYLAALAAAWDVTP